MATRISREVLLDDLHVVDLNGIPNPDYDNHPAYGRLFDRPRLPVRIKAIKKKWWGCGPLLRDMVRLAFKKVKRSTYIIKAEKTQCSAVLDRLRRDGATAIRLNLKEEETISQKTREFIRKLEAKRAQIPDGQRKHRDNSLSIPREEAPDLYASLDKILASHEILSAASHYLGFPVSYDCYLQINEPCDTSFWKGQFTDIRLPYPKTTYMHIDSAIGVLKCIIYLSHVTKNNGPFSYVIGSHRKVGLFERIVRKANDLTGLDGRGRETRELFWALPKPLRKMMHFNTPIAESICMYVVLG